MWAQVSAEACKEELEVYSKNILTKNILTFTAQVSAEACKEELEVMRSTVFRNMEDCR